MSGSQPLEDLSTPGQGQGEGPGDSKSERSEDDDDDGRGRSERSERSSSRGWLPDTTTHKGKKKKSLTESISCQGLPKNGGDLLSQLVGQYHRRG